MEQQEQNIKQKPGVKSFILIILFAIVVGVIVQESISLVVQRFLDIPPEHMGIADWGDTFFLRILASLVSTTIGAFIIGTFLVSRAKIAALIAATPTILFWLFALVVSYSYVAEAGFLAHQVKSMILIPISLAILSPVVAYYGAKFGESYHNHFERSKSVLDIKWYHWLWILPFFLNKIVAVLLFTFISLIWFDFSYGWTGMYPGLLDFITNWGYYLGRLILLFVLIGLVAAVNHAYSLLTQEAATSKEKWIKGAILFGYVLLFSILHVIIFGEYL